MEQRCQNPHPKLPGRMCNTLQHVKGFGQVSVECRHCGGWIEFDFEESGTESTASFVVASPESRGITVKEISSTGNVT